MLASHSLPFNFLVSQPVREFLAAWVKCNGRCTHGPAAMRDHTSLLADRERASLVQKMQQSSVTVAGDGGTIKKRKLLAFCIGVPDQVATTMCFLWRLFTVSDQKALSVYFRTGVILDTLRSLHVWVVGLVADNHGAMQSGFRKAAHDRSLYVIRCACHNLQLLVKDISKGCKKIQAALRVLDMVFLGTSHQQRKDDMGLNLSRCATRWHVEHDNLQQIFEARAKLLTVLNISNEQFLAVDVTIHTYRPVKVASRILEKDSASQIDVLCVLCGLYQKFHTVAERRALVKRLRRNFASEILLCAAFGIPGLFHSIKQHEDELQQQQQQNGFDCAATCSDIAGLAELVVKCCTASTLNYHNISAAQASKNIEVTVKTVEADVQRQVNLFIENTRMMPEKAYTSLEVQMFWYQRFARSQDLARFMQAVFTTLPSEASCERVFSHSKLVLDATRMSLKERPTECQTFLKFNTKFKKPATSEEKADHVEQGLINLMSTLPASWDHLVEVVTHLYVGFVNKDHLRGNVTKEVWKLLSGPREDEDGEDLQVDEEDDDGDVEEDVVEVKDDSEEEN